MKKLAIILLGLFPLVLSSCLKEEEDYFDKSASARIEEAVKNAISVLEGAENGWAVKYYPNPGRGSSRGHGYDQDGQAPLHRGIRPARRR